MTNKALKYTLFVIIGISVLYWLGSPTLVEYVQLGIVFWNWSIDQVLNFGVYHPFLFALIPLAIILLLAHK